MWCWSNHSSEGRGALREEDWEATRQASEMLANQSAEQVAGHPDKAWASSSSAAAQHTHPAEGTCAGRWV